MTSRPPPPPPQYRKVLFGIKLSQWRELSLPVIIHNHTVPLDTRAMKNENLSYWKPFPVVYKWDYYNFYVDCNTAKGKRTAS